MRELSQKQREQLGRSNGQRVTLYRSEAGEPATQFQAIAYEVPVRVRKVNEDGPLELSGLPADRSELLDVGQCQPLNIEGVTNETLVTAVDLARGIALVEPLNALPVSEWGLLTVYWELP